MICCVNTALLKKVCRKAIIAAGKGVLNRAVDRPADEKPSDLVQATANLAGQQMAGVLREILPVNPVDDDVFCSCYEIDGFTIVLVHLDGGEGYVYGLPNYALGIAVTKKNEPVFAGVYNPYYNQLFFAEEGKSLKRNNQQTSVNSIRSLHESYLGLAYRGHYDERGSDILNTFFRVMATPVRTMIPGSDLYGLSMVANGNLTAMVIGQPNYRRILPGLMLVSHAGGKVTDLNGQKPDEFSEFVVATNGKVHNELLQHLGLAAETR